jgi:hypothetical protein
MTPRLSILIITWNAWPHLRRCLASLRANEDAEFEIVVIDNASTDGTVANVRRHFPRVRVHANPSNLGGARALNQGFSLVSGEYVLRLDADTELHREAIARLLRFLDDRPDVSVVAPRTYNSDGSVQESARSFPTPLSGLFGRQSLLTRLFPNNRFSRRYLRRDMLTATEPFQVEQVSAACMLLRRSLVAEAGPWDEGYPAAYWDDTDWCRTLHQLGKKIYCVPQAAVVHHESNHAGKKKSPRRIWMFHLGAYRFYRKHYTLGPFDPRALVALAALTVRAGLLLVHNHFLPDAPVEPLVPRPAPAGSVLEERVS